MVILQRTIPFIYRPMHVDASLNFIRLLRVVITPLVKSESTGCQCRPLTSPTPTPIHWQLSVKAMNSAVNFFFFLQFSSVGCHLPRSEQLIFHFQNSLMWIFFFFAVPWSQLTSISFFNFVHRKEQVWCFQNVTNRQSLCIFLVELSKPYLLNRNAYVLSIQHPRITSLGRCFYANSYTDVSTDITF